MNRVLGSGGMTKPIGSMYFLSVLNESSGTSLCAMPPINYSARSAVGISSSQLRSSSSANNATRLGLIFRCLQPQVNPVSTHLYTHECPTLALIPVGTPASRDDLIGRCDQILLRRRILCGNKNGFDIRILLFQSLLQINHIWRFNPA